MARLYSARSWQVGRFDGLLPGRKMAVAAGKKITALIG